jgi:hypothetical protein
VRLAICVKNRGYPAALEVRKVYRVVPDREAAAHRLLRVIDESGEDYLYPRESSSRSSSPARPRWPSRAAREGEPGVPRPRR